VAKRLSTLGSLLHGVYEYNVLRRFRRVPLRQLVIDVTYRCNSRCVMCSIWSAEPQPELTLAQFATLLADPLFRGVERLMLSGGEPTLRPDLVELVEACFECMPSLFSLSLITNGLAPDRVISLYGDIARRCAERGIRLSISVSLDGVGEIHDRMRNIPNAFAKVEQTLEGLGQLRKKYGFYLGVGCVVCHLTLPHLQTLADWCLQRDVDLGYQLVGFHDTYVNNIAQQSVLDFTEDDRPALHALLQRLASGRSLRNPMASYWADMLHMYAKGRPRQSPCAFLVDSLVLDAAGNIRVCETAANIGNCLESGSCSKLYFSEKASAMRSAMKSGACLNCNSGCMVNIAWRKDLFKYLGFLMRGG
jgi:MoaA/NifB/PqqE/SkfB family radical SAM enzyme